MPSKGSCGETGKGACRPIRITHWANAGARYQKRNFRMKNRPLLSSLVLLPLIFFLVGCAGKKSLPVVSGPDISKSWNLTATVDECSCGSSGQKIKGIFTVNRAGSGFSGTFYNFYGKGGSVDGEISGETVSFVIHQKEPCAGIFKGTGTVNEAGTEIRGTYGGRDCGNSLNASFVARADD